MSAKGSKSGIKVRRTPPDVPPAVHLIKVQKKKKNRAPTYTLIITGDLTHHHQIKKQLCLRLAACHSSSLLSFIGCRLFGQIIFSNQTSPSRKVAAIEITALQIADA